MQTGSWILPTFCVRGVKIACPFLAYFLPQGGSKRLAQILPISCLRGVSKGLPKSCPNLASGGSQKACPNLAQILPQGGPKMLAIILPISCLRASRAGKKWAKIGQAFWDPPEARHGQDFGKLF